MDRVVVFGVEVLVLDGDVDVGGVFVAALAGGDDSEVGGYFVLTLGSPTLFFGDESERRGAENRSVNAKREVGAKKRELGSRRRTTSC